MHSKIPHSPIGTSGQDLYQALAITRGMPVAYGLPFQPQCEADAAWEIKMKELNWHWRPSRAGLAEDELI